MSDDIDIRSGGAIAVDTDRLRAGARGCREVANRLDELQRSALHEAVQLTARLTLGGVVPRVWAIAWRLQRAAHEAAALAQRLAHLATVYEIVELDVARRAARGEDARRVELRLRELISGDPAAATDAQGIEADWKTGGIDAVAGQYSAFGVAFGLGGAATVGGVVRGMGTLIDTVGAGTIPRSAVLAGARQPVRLRRLDGPPHHFTPPASLQDAASRIPRGDARVRVEKYAMPDGSNRFALYVAGTNTKGGAREAWDWDSNLELYGGRRSASFDATEEALRAAGAEPGDAIYEFGHSQGGMIAGHVALEGGYDTRALVTFGSPTEAQVDAGTLSVQLRHTDDPVAALAGGGSAGRVGAADSVVVQRFADPAVGVGDIDLASHHLDTYEQTAALFDRSDDARAGAVRERLHELRGAASVQAFDFAVERVSPK
ncbi:hypothetical protein [Microbacterium rhizosphaerae]|uniref:Alpha/beta hydrolase n=1 Tax=Microbacterium rhizosphaerae TaxID=1678237 RepID=A0ABZ0SQD4_9MICO|nr:hypothetical protein [Microbacterium rhizosphaerae]WPR90033.1 hypothetical protein SM116_01730 [Microbacterium rhizosphaerae]